MVNINLQLIFSTFITIQETFDTWYILRKKTKAKVILYTQEFDLSNQQDFWG